VKLTAVLGVSGDWYTVEVPEIPGLFTQARELGEVPVMVKDAAALLLGKPAEEFDVEIHWPFGKPVAR
jgi:predicted RNase H-like HicB family nuclease